MNAVTKQEVVSLIEGLIESDACMGSISDKQVVIALEVVSRIKQRGIAPPDGMVLVPVDPTDAMQTAHDMYGDTSDWWNAVISAVIRAVAPDMSKKPENVNTSGGYVDGVEVKP